MATTVSFVRRPFTGSCHCGNVKYVAYLALPSSPEDIDVEHLKEKSGLRIYKCNCNTCQKMGIFHLRLRSAPDDFLLLSPLEPEAEDSSLTRYLTALKRSSWWFCKICGVRCFTVRHPAENTEAEVPVESLQKLGIKEKSDAEGPDDVVKVPVYKLKSEGFAESPHGTSYFSLNAVTLDAHQEGLNLAQWHENRWVQYVDSLGDGRGWKTGEPHPGGIY